MNLKINFLKKVKGQKDLETDFKKQFEDTKKKKNVNFKLTYSRIKIKIEEINSKKHIEETILILT